MSDHWLFSEIENYVLYMKICTICKKSKQKSEFSPCKTAKDGKYSHCKTCHNETMRNRYKDDPKSKLEDCRRRRQVLFDIVNDIKSKCGCKICTEHDPVCLDFHHIDPTKKDLEISKLVFNKSRVRMLEEIKKCVVVSIVTSKSFNIWFWTLGNIICEHDMQLSVLISMLWSMSNVLLVELSELLK